MEKQDTVKVQEVILFAENDANSYRALIDVYLPNLQKKRFNGTYDKSKAPKLMEYYYQNYVRPSMKNPRNYGYDPKLNPGEREVFGKHFADVLWDEYLKDIKPKSKVKGIPKAKRKLK